MAQDATEQSTEPNDTPQTPPEPATPPQAPARDAVPAGTDTPPWERDGEQFDPAKAWSLIRHLREDNTKLKATNESNAARLAPRVCFCTAGRCPDSTEVAPRSSTTATTRSRG